MLLLRCEFAPAMMATRESRVSNAIQRNRNVIRVCFGWIYYDLAGRLWLAITDQPRQLWLTAVSQAQQSYHVRHNKSDPFPPDKRNK